MQPLEPPKHHHEEIDCEQPDEDHLPEPEIARRPLIPGHLRVAIEKAFSDFENVNAARENEDEANAENNPQSKDGSACCRASAENSVIQDRSLPGTPVQVE